MDEFADALLVHGVAERPQQRDRDPRHLLGEELADGLAGGILVEGDDDVAVPVEPFGHLQGVFLRDETVGLALSHHILELLR